MFITDEDYKVVIGESALKVVSQVSTKNRSNAEMEAQEEMAGYLRPKYDCATGSWSCTAATSRSTTWLHPCRRRWAWRYARNVTKEPSSGWRACRPGRLYRICRLSWTRTGSR